jgi:sphingolipid 4-desaturase/C4-monooxygenase
MGADKK